MRKLTGYLRLMRPANIVTAVSDILAGVAISGYLGAHTPAPVDNVVPILWLVLATTGLYGGGVVFNDVFDADLDRVERPERPIPSGLIPLRHAVLLGSALLLLGIGAAFQVPNTWSAGIAGAIAAAALVYDRWGKHHFFLGPLNMGLCRGLNLLLGISILPEALGEWWMVALVPVLYIAAITAVSRGEVHGGSKKALYGAVFLYTLVIAAIFLLSLREGNPLITLAFLAMLMGGIFPPLFRAIREPVGPKIGKAVKAGVLALILLNASWAAAFGFPVMSLVILLLLPLSLLLAYAFAVT